MRSLIYLLVVTAFVASFTILARADDCVDCDRLESVRAATVASPLAIRTLPSRAVIVRQSLVRPVQIVSGPTYSVPKANYGSQGGYASGSGYGSSGAVSGGSNGSVVTRTLVPVQTRVTVPMTSNAYETSVPLNARQTRVLGRRLIRGW